MSATTSTVLCVIRLLLPVALLLGDGARAQTPACEQFKGVLATRLRLDTQRFTLEGVPAGTTLAPGAKAVGTCGGGAYKILQVRKGEAAPEAPAAVRPLAASASAAAPASAPASAPKSAPKSAPVPASRPAASAAPPAVVASAAQAVAAEPVATPPASEAANPPAVAPSTSALPGAGFIADYGRWLLLLVALPLAAWGWRWFTYGRYYDKNGLPRGPSF
jgi:hypothetical protein